MADKLDKTACYSEVLVQRDKCRCAFLHLSQSCTASELFLFE